MVARLDGLNAGVFGVPESAAREGVEEQRVRAGQYRGDDEYRVTVLARLGPLWLVTRPHSVLGVMSDGELSRMPLDGENDVLVHIYAEAGYLR